MSLVTSAVPLAYVRDYITFGYLRYYGTTVRSKSGRAKFPATSAVEPQYTHTQYYVMTPGAEDSHPRRNKQHNIRIFDDCYCNRSSLCAPIDETRIEDLTTLQENDAHRLRWKFRFWQGQWVSGYFAVH